MNDEATADPARPAAHRSASRTARWTLVGLAVALIAGVLWYRTLPADLADLGGAVRAIEGPLGLRSQAATVALGDGTVLIWGGRNISTESGHVYDPATDGWDQLAAAPGPRRFGAATVWTGDEAIIWGGSSSVSPLALDLAGIAWNPRTEQWRELPAAPHGLLHARAVVFGADGVLFTGGEQPDRGEPADLWFDLRTERWHEVPNTVRVQNVAWHDGRLLGTGPTPPAASDGDRPRSWSVLAFDPDRSAWSEAAPAVETDWLALATDDETLTAVSVDSTVRGHVLGADGWDRVAEVDGKVGAINTVEPTGYPPVTVWTGDRLVLGGGDGLLAWDPAARRFAGISDRRIRTFGGNAVWTGDHVVSLANQAGEGWVWTPAADR